MKKITVAGLGAGSLDQLPLGIYRLLNSGLPVYLRTKEHPAIFELEKEGLVYQSFDHIYEMYDGFDEVYKTIVKELLKAAEKGPIIYAVPGHPIVAERTIQLLLEKREAGETEIEFAGGQSFLDPLFQAVLADPIEGFQLLDGTDFHKDDVMLKQHIIIGQVYDQMIASNVKLELMDILPDNYDVYIVTNAGTANEQIQKVPLYLLDHDWQLSNLTSVYVPPVREDEILYKNFSYLKNIIATLRGPNGCPWDKKQTHQSLKKYLIEEAYEVLEAIDEENDEHLAEELGDLLLQVLLHAQIGEDNGYFTISDVIEALSTKMIRRHPHVFGGVNAESAEEVSENWQRIKAEEKKDEHKVASQFEKIGKGLPAMLQAYEIQKAAKKVGFDWEDPLPALRKVKEELEEAEEEIIQNGKTENIASEIGDVLFSIVNVSRLLSIHPEEALLKTNIKFIKRLRYIEEKVNLSNKPFDDYTLEELDEIWEEAKKSGL